MRQSRHLGKTLKETPNEAQTIAHQLMLRAGYIKQISAGIYTYMPLLFRVIQKVSNIIREEMNKKGAEELLMPALQPRELWEESERWERYTKIDGIMFAFKDRRGGAVCLGPTHEEIITDVVRREVNSYKDLPLLLYQIQNKFRDEIRPRFGLMRTREFIMKDAYSFDIDEKGLNRTYESMFEAYHNICKRCGFKYRCVEADSGSIGGKSSHEFMVLADTGEDTILYCNNCDYAANIERAESKLEEQLENEEKKEMKAILGTGIIGVKPLAEFLKIPVWKTTKTMIYQADEEVVAVMVRGDCDVHEIKVQNYLKCDTLQLATPETIKQITGANIGYAGPVGLPENIKILADNYTNHRINFECGANKTDYHNINVNFGRDFPMPIFGDFKLAKKEDICPCCNNGKLQETRGIEVGHIFKLGTKYSEKLKATYLNKEGKNNPIVMGCYGIGVSRITAAIIEQNHDEKGMIWPANIAPYHIHLIGLNTNNDIVVKKTEAIYHELLKDFEVLYDDRDLHPGQKFGDADLIGLPIRITMSKRLLEQDKVELKYRNESKLETISFAEAKLKIKSFLSL